ncbi:MAG: hypothetical protein GEU91_15875 [Rhizobiales bacterium]|nr:hypothetical protein [Hyphomicrobiales bacterium]
MPTSIFLAKLIGPIVLVAAVALFLNATAYKTMAQEFLNSPPLIYLSGILAMTAGVAIVLYHNVWTADWRVIITLFGWAGAIGGAARILLPAQVKTIGEKMIRLPMGLTIGGAGWVLFGAVLCFYGYFR